MKQILLSGLAAVLVLPVFAADIPDRREMFKFP